jgi:20S proteasome subunit beta 1
MITKVSAATLSFSLIETNAPHNMFHTRLYFPWHLVDLLLTLCFFITIASASSPGFSPSRYQWKHAAIPEKSIEIDMGTTLVAIKFDGGVVVGADSRTSASGYVSNKMAYKINAVLSSQASQCVICRSGSAADTQHVVGIVKRKFQAQKMMRLLHQPSISQVAHFIRHIIRNNVNKDNAPPLQASLICAGYDAYNENGQIFAIMPGGTLYEEEHFCVSGSGSTLLLGLLDAKVKEKIESNKATPQQEYLFTRQEAMELVKHLLQLSITRDGSSGGLIRIFIMDENGIEQQTVYPSVPKMKQGMHNECHFAQLDGFALPKVVS